MLTARFWRQAGLVLALLKSASSLLSALALERKAQARAEQTGRLLTCPNTNELCQRFKAHHLLAEVARSRRADGTHW
jgi:hypothetical protein